MHKQRIPTLAAAVLVFGGCGDDDDKKSGKESLAALIPKVCEKAMECDDGNVDQAECEEEFEMDLEDGELGNYSDACLSAIADFYDCYVELTCEELDQEDPDEKCLAVGDKADELCDFDEEEE